MTDVAARALRRRYRQVYRYVRRRTASAEDAEDVTQEVFAAAAARLEALTPGAQPPLAWLYTVAHRRLVDEARRGARRNGASPAPYAAADRVYGAELARTLRRTLLGLPDDARRVVVLKVLEGKPFAVVATELGITEGAAKMRLARALERLRQALEEEGVEP